MGFIDRLANAWKIFKMSFEFIGRDKSLLAVPILMLISGIFFVIAAVVVFLFVSVLPRNYFYPSMLIFLLIANIWSVFLGAMQSWMVYEVAKGKDTTVFSGFKRAIKNFSDIVAYAFVFLIISLLLGALRRRGRLGEFAAGWLGLLAGIVGKLVLPAMIITERSFVEAVAQLRESTRAIPEILTYEIGIRPITTLMVFFGIILTFILGYTFGILVAVVFLIAFIVLIILLTLFINNTYYTLLYLTLIEKKHVKGLHLR